jgi:hypothetical protein
MNSLCFSGLWQMHAIVLDSSTCQAFPESPSRNLRDALLWAREQRVQIVQFARAGSSGPGEVASNTSGTFQGVQTLGLESGERYQPFAEGFFVLKLSRRRAARGLLPQQNEVCSSAASVSLLPSVICGAHHSTSAAHRISEG